MPRPVPSSRPKPPLRVALVGAGGIGRAHAAALREVHDLTLAAAVDIDEGARTAAADAWGVPTFASVREMAEAMRSEPPNAAIVATPPAMHEDAGLQLLGQGVHVLCEKPLTTSGAAATRMFATASRADAVLMMASKFRYLPDVIEARRLVREGLLGDLVWLEVSFCQPRAMQGRWHVDPRVSGGGVLIDQGTHAADLVRGFLGPIVRVFAHLGRRVQPVPVEDSVLVHMESGAGASALARLSWAMDAAAEHFLQVHGSRGTLQLGWLGGRYRLRGEEAWTTFGTGSDETGALARQLQDFAWLITKPGHEPLIRADDAIDSVRVIEAAYRAARVERWIPVQGYAGEFA